MLLRRSAGRRRNGRCTHLDKGCAAGEVVDVHSGVHLVDGWVGGPDAELWVDRRRGEAHADALASELGVDHELVDEAGRAVVVGAVLLAGAGLQPVATPEFAADEARHLIAGEGGPNGRLAGGQPAEVLAHRLVGDEVERSRAVLLVEGEERLRIVIWIQPPVLDAVEAPARHHRARRQQRRRQAWRKGKARAQCGACHQASGAREHAAQAANRQPEELPVRGRLLLAAVAAAAALLLAVAGCCWVLLAAPRAIGAGRAPHQRMPRATRHNPPRPSRCCSTTSNQRLRPPAGRPWLARPPWLLLVRLVPDTVQPYGGGGGCWSWWLLRCCVDCARAASARIPYSTYMEHAPVDEKGRTRF
jgi:hypothetical protein